MGSKIKALMQFVGKPQNCLLCKVPFFYWEDCSSSPTYTVYKGLLQSHTSLWESGTGFEAGHKIKYTCSEWSPIMSLNVFKLMLIETGFIYTFTHASNFFIVEVIWEVYKLPDHFFFLAFVLDSHWWLRLVQIVASGVARACCWPCSLMTDQQPQLFDALCKTSN